MNALCDWLDEFLDGELPSQDEEAFRRHLDGCDRCRGEMETQRWLDETLMSVRDKPIPAQVIRKASDRVQLTERRTRRRRWGTIIGMVAASALVWIGWPSGSQEESFERKLVERVPTETVEEPIQQAMPSPIRVTVAPDLIAVPVDLPHRDFTILKVYPAVFPRPIDADETRRETVEPDLLARSF